MKGVYFGGAAGQWGITGTLPGPDFFFFPIRDTISNASRELFFPEYFSLPGSNFVLVCFRTVPESYFPYSNTFPTFPSNFFSTRFVHVSYFSLPEYFSPHVMHLA
jgi:hypothetical protein